MNKRKIINDPIYGFITIPNELIFDIIENPIFQRLRRIKQLGLTDLIYPGAFHSRFHHALGSLHLMHSALNNLRTKGHEISNEEYQACLIAILLHDIGHGPFSHALEKSLIPNIHHEKISEILITHLNTLYNGQLSLAKKIFLNKYDRKFFHQLVSSQLDIDRLDYLNRDSFFTGVLEGTIGAERIIKMLNIKNDQLVVEEKGIYSIENFISARRIMYWQVYLHKTTVSSEKLLINIIKRATYLIKKGENLFATPALKIFLSDNITAENFQKNKHFLEAYTQLDDYDIWASIKMWCTHSDKVLNTLSNFLLKRKLYKAKISNTPPSLSEINELKEKVEKKYKLKKDEVEYYISNGSISNAAYILKGNQIKILTKDETIIEISKATDLPNIKAMSKIVKKYYICWANA